MIEPELEGGLMGIGDYLLKIGGISCPQCSYQFTMNDLNQQRPGEKGEVTCPKCASKVTTDSLKQQRQDKKDQYYKNLEISPTKEFSTNADGSLSLDLPWGKVAGTIIIIGVPVWLGIIFLLKEGNPWYGQSIFLGLSNWMVMALGAIPTFLLGLAMLVNKKQITANQSAISCSDGPVWFNNLKQYPALNLLKITVCEISSSHSDGHSSLSYKVVLEFKSGKKATLCKLNSVDDAVNIERSLSKYYALNEQKSD